MNKRILLVGAAIGLAIFVITAWAFGRFESKDPIVAELEEIRDREFARRDEMSKEEQAASKQKFGARLKGLSEEQRRQFFESSMPVFMKMAEARIDKFLQLSPEEQTAELDRKIDKMQARRAEQAAAGQQDNQSRGRWADKSPAEIDTWRKKMLDWTTPELRAKFEIAMEKYKDRLEQRGMEPEKGWFF